VFPIDIGEALRHARALVAKAEDEAAKQAYLDILRADPTENARRLGAVEGVITPKIRALSPAAMSALARIHAILGLEYGGIDFALAADGSVLLFEANATMVVFPPNPEPIWDYRRSAIDRVLKAATQMLLRHAER
jgi:hypothetical protein